MESDRKIRAYVKPYAEVCARRLQANPRDPDALFTSAAIAAMLHRTEEATRALDRLVQVAPHYPGVWWLKARVFRDAGNGRMEMLCVAAARNEGSNAAPPGWVRLLDEDAPRTSTRARADRRELVAAR